VAKRHDRGSLSRDGAAQRKTLEELEGTWPESPDETFLTSRCAALRRKRLDQLTAEDLRIMIGQNIGSWYRALIRRRSLSRNGSGSLL
jgi:hypothetical protein